MVPSPPKYVTVLEDDTAFWDVAPRSPVDADWRFKGAYYKATIPEDCHLHICHHESLKSHLLSK
jgi:hypothetical protein